MTAPSSTRHPGILVAPLVTFVAVVLMLVVARFYDRLPAQLPDCGFLKSTGIPCAACGGTRSMQSLANGKIKTAVKFHPFFATMAMIAPIWLAFGIRRFLQHQPMPEIAIQNRRLKIGACVFFALLVLNWIYLILFLP